MTDPLRFLGAELTRLEALSLLRSPGETAPGPAAINLSSNDYLGLAAQPLPSAETVRAGAGASPLVVGSFPEHARAEAAIRSWLEAESATFFTSGYAANVGAISSLVGRGDLILSDRLNHASIIDGCRLSGATVEVFGHLDHAEARRLLAEHGPKFRRRLLATESCFSMDGDSPDLAELARACTAHDAVLYVDEAHALGVFGPEGRGLCAATRVRPDVLVGTLGKAVGLQGAFVAGSRDLQRWLWNRARSFVFSTALAPVLAAAVPDRVIQVRRADAERRRLEAVASELRATLAELGAQVPSVSGPIVPWVLGEADRALAASVRLLEQGIVAKAIRPPTVPPQSSRIRFAASASIDDSQLAVVLRALRQTAGR
jgi:8-amino-7-oxononanoate synthase